MLARTEQAIDIGADGGAQTGGFGAHSVLECVGTDKAIDTAVGIARPGGAIGRVGVPHYEAIPGSQPAFYKNVTVGGGPAPVRALSSASSARTSARVAATTQQNTMA